MILYSFLQFVAVLFFGSATYVQINDPDPEVWITVYLIPATLSMLLFLKPGLQNNGILLTVGKITASTYFGYACWLLLISYEVDDKLDEWLIHEEVGREFAGLLISAVWLWIISRPSQKQSLLLAFLMLVIPIAIWVFIYFEESVRKKWPKHCQSIAYYFDD